MEKRAVWVRDTEGVGRRLGSRARVWNAVAHLLRQQRVALPDVVPELVHGEAARDRETREEGAQPRPKYHGHHSTSTYNLLSRLRRPTRSFVLSSFEEGRSPSITITIASESRDHTLSLSQQRARPLATAKLKSGVYLFCPSAIDRSQSPLRPDRRSAIFE